MPAVGQAPATSAADQTTPPRDQAKPALTLAEVESAMAAMEVDAAIESSVKDLLRTKYKQAIETLQTAASDAAKAEEYRDALTQAPARTTELRGELEELPSAEEAGMISAAADPDQIGQALDAQRAKLAAFQEQLSSVASDASLAEQRPTEISERIPEAERELAEVRSQLASPDMSQEVTSPGRVADRFVLQAREMKLINELEMLKQEQLSQSVRRSLQQARKELLTRQVENAAAAVASYEALLSKQVKELAQDIGARAEELAVEVPEDDQFAAALATEVQELAKQLESVLQDRERITAAKADVTAKLQRLTARYDSIKKQLDLDPAGVEMTQVLIGLRILMHTRAQEVAKKRPWPTLADTRLAGVQVEFKIDGQRDLQERLAARASGPIEDLLAARSEVLSKLQTQYLDLVPIQASLDSEARLYLDKVREIHAEIRQELFWIQNSPPLAADTLGEIPAGLRWVFGPEHWWECGRAVETKMSREPISSVIVLLAAVTLLIMRPRIGAALRRSGDGVGRISTDRFGLTGKAAFWTALLALPVPLLVQFVASALAQAESPSLWLRDINRGMAGALLVIVAASSIAACCYPGGLADVHFGWRKPSLRWLRRGSYWVAAVYIPLGMLAYCTLSAESGRFLHSLGRASLLLALGWLSVLLVRLFFFSDVIRAAPVRESLTQLGVRSPYLWFILLIVGLVGQMMLIGAGYTMTVFNLSFAIVITLIIIASGVFLFSLALRWFKIQHRKLAFAEALERRRARQESAASEGKVEEAGEIICVDEDERALDLDSVGEQTLSVLRLCLGLGIAIAVFSFWSQTLPLISYLDTITVPVLSDFTLLELAECLLVVGVAWLVTKNLPGILELTFLRATSADAGTRHAITTICQYAVVATGLVALFSILNVDWAKFGWIVGGLSVGIGFGMQEVVANFICGLILLFERPIRVGDVVTVEGTTGTVTKLRMRATTITNWDRQDFVVPNKTLITGTILNWTLSALNRITIPVGVAYGSDTARARQILLDAAADDPHILEDPAPLASFEQFGDSSLNLVLRAYLPNIDNRLATINDLHTEIDKRFAAAGIEIAFPQQDIHIRDGLARAFGDAGGSFPDRQESTDRESERSIAK